MYRASPVIVLLWVLVGVGCGGGGDSTSSSPSLAPAQDSAAPPPAGGSGSDTNPPPSSEPAPPAEPAPDPEPDPPSEPSPPPPPPVCLDEDAPGVNGLSLGAIVNAMAPGTWVELACTQMQDVFPAQAGHPAWAVQGPKAVTLAWGGAAYDTARNRLLITGGGHGDYGGNEVYEFNAESFLWTRVTEPSAMEVDSTFAAMNEPEKYFRTLDGSPVSSHTYDGLQYLPNIDRMFKYGGSFYQIGTAYDRHAYLYDPATRTWERKALAPMGNSGSVEVSTDYDPATGRVLVSYANGLAAYDPVQDTWQILSGSNNQNFGRVGALDTQRKRFVQADSAAGTLVYFKLDPQSGRQIAPVTGDTGFTSFKAPGIAYHAATDRFVIWAGDREVWAVDAATWVSTRWSAAGPAPDHSGTYGGRLTAGIYSRWQWVPQYDVMLAYPHSNQNVWLYRLPSAE